MNKIYLIAALLASAVSAQARTHCELLVAMGTKNIAEMETRSELARTVSRAARDKGWRIVDGFDMIEDSTSYVKRACRDIENENSPAYEDCRKKNNQEFKTRYLERRTRTDQIVALTVRTDMGAVSIEGDETSTAKPQRFTSVAYSGVKAGQVVATRSQAKTKMYSQQQVMELLNQRARLELEDESRNPELYKTYAEKFCRRSRKFSTRTVTPECMEELINTTLSLYALKAEVSRLNNCRPE